MDNLPVVRENQTPLSEVITLGKIFAQSGYFADAKEAAQSITKILAGAELGLPPIASMNGVYIVKGRPTLSANLMAAAVKRSGKYKYRVLEQSDQVCKIAFFEKEDGKWEEIGTSVFTLADARRAGTQNLDKYAQNMLFARAMSNGVKFYTPDVFFGPVYTPDELGAGVDGETGDVIPGSYTVTPPEASAALPAAPVSTVESPASPSEPILSQERADLQQTAKERFNAREFSHFLWQHFQARQIRDLSETECVKALSLIEDLTAAKAQIAEVDTETGEIFEEDAFEGDGGQQKQDREELLSAIADLEAAAEQQGDFNAPDYRKMIGIPPTLSLCSTDHLKTYRNQLSAYVSQDEGIFGEETPPVTNSTDIRALR